MNRTHTRSGQDTEAQRSESSVARSNGEPYSQGSAQFGTWLDQLFVRMVFTTACVAAGYHFHPFSLMPLAAAIVGLLFSLAVFLFEIRLRRASLRRLIGAAVGSILGIL